MSHNTTLTLVLSLFFASCLSTKPKLSTFAYVKPSKSNSLEIQIPYTSSSYGNMHGISFKKYYSRESDWIYIARQQKIITSDSLILIKGKNYKRTTNIIKGEISIIGSIMTLHLKTPIYKGNTVKRWINYDLNGVYILH